jgi:hypothetical protein
MPSLLSPAAMSQSADLWPTSLGPRRRKAYRPVVLAVATLGALTLAGPTSVAGAVGTTATTVAATPSILNNGSFALKGKAPAGVWQVVIDPPPYKAAYPLLGWVVGAEIQVCSASVYPPPPGVSQSVVGGSVSQTVKTTAGWSYRLSWYGAGVPGNVPVPFRVTHVLWDGKLVAAPSFKTSSIVTSNPVWHLLHVVVTATSSRSTVEFVDATAAVDLGSVGRPSMVAEASLAGDAGLYLPATATMPPTGGKLVAVVRMPSGTPVTDPSLSVKLYGTWKTVSYAPVTTQLIATGTVVGGQAVLKVHLPASLAHKVIPAYATLSGKGFLSATDKLKIAVS